MYNIMRYYIIVLRPFGARASNNINNNDGFHEI